MAEASIPGACRRGRRGQTPCPRPTRIYTTVRPFDAVFARPSRIICGRPNVTRSVQKPVQNPAQNRAGKPVVRADVRRRRCLLFGSRSSLSRAWSGPCRGAALSEEPGGHAGGRPGGTDASCWILDRQERRYSSASLQEIPYHFLLNLSNHLERIFGAGNAGTSAKTTVCRPSGSWPGPAAGRAAGPPASTNWRWR